MFEQTFVDGVGQTKKTWTVLLAFGAQIVVMIVAVLIPMIYFDVLPKTQLTSLLVAPPPPPPPPPPAPETPTVKTVKVIPRQFDAGVLTAPKSIPKNIAVIQEDELPPPSVSVGVAGGTGLSTGMGSMLNSIMSQVPTMAAPPPPPKMEQTIKRVKVGGNVKPPVAISTPQPVYPPLAKATRITGTVVLHAIIATDGTIKELQPIGKPHPMLLPAAMAAVRTWRYKPQTLNDEPVEVDLEITINFTLN